MSFLKTKLVEIYSKITLEPLIFLIALISLIDDELLTKLLTYKVCINKFDFGGEICSNLDKDEFKEYNEQVLEQYAKYSRFCVIVPILLQILSGVKSPAWSQTYGQKRMMSVFWGGQFLGIALLLLNVFFRDCPPELYVIHIIPLNILGGWPSMWLSPNVLMKGVGEHKRKGLMILVLILSLISASQIAPFIGHFVHQLYGLEGCLAIAITGQIVGTAYLMWIIPSYLKDSEEKKKD